MRGSKNDASELFYLRQQKSVHDLFNVGLLSCKYHPYLAAFPDSIVSLDYPEFYADCGFGDYRSIDVGVKRYAMSVVKIKTAVSVQSLGTALSKAEAGMCCMHIDSEDAANSIPVDHIAQITLRLTVVMVNFALYMYAVE